MRTLRVSRVKTRDDVVWVVFLCCGVCVCVCVCEPSSYEAQRESPARPRPGRSIAAPFRVCAFSRVFRVCSANRVRRGSLQQSCQERAPFSCACGAPQARGAPRLASHWETTS